MAWNVFDRSGNKIGEIHKLDADPGGCGCVAKGIGTLIILGLAIVIWPVVLMNPSGISIAMILSQILTLVVHGYWFYKRDYFTFFDTWLGLLATSTIASGVIGWLVSGLAFSMLFLSLFIAFLSSLSSSLITTIILPCLYHHSNDNENEEDNAVQKYNRSDNYTIPTINKKKDPTSNIWTCRCGTQNSSNYGQCKKCGHYRSS